MPRASSITASTGRSASSVRTRASGVITSTARRSPNSSDRCSSVAVATGRVPCIAERRTSEASSSAERADANSSVGSMPSRRTTAFAEPFSSATGAAIARVKPHWNACTERAVASGCAIARFFGTSSPKTIVSVVASASAIATATPSTAAAGTPSDSNGESIARAIAGSARKPIVRFVSVIPSCAADSCVDSERSAASTP